MRRDLDRFAAGLGPLLNRAETELARVAPAVERARQALRSAGEALDAVRGAGLALAGRPATLPGPASLSPVPLVLLPALAAGKPARFAVFDVPDRAALVREGASTCVATVVGGRLVYRGR